MDIVIAGRVKTGMGHASYFMKQPGYRKQFIKRLGMDPYPGTLNLKLSGIYAARLRLIKKRRSIVIKGFKSGRETFNKVSCYKAYISGTRCALVIPKKSHADVAEIISEKRLTRAFNLKNGSMVRVRVIA